MKISQVSIQTVLGIGKQLSFTPGRKLTEIRGRNGTGKTSVLEALKCALGGGSIANLARVGADSPPEVVLALDDRTRVRVRGKGRDVEVPVDTSEGTAYAAVKKPQAHLSGLFDTALANPVVFLTAPPAERAELLLGALPLELDLAKLWEELPPEARAALESVNRKLHPLQVLAAVRQHVFDLRTDINRRGKEKEASAKELSSSLPADAGKDWAADIAALENQHRALDEQRRAKLAAAGMAEQEMLAGIEASRKDDVDRVRASQKAAYEKLVADTEARIEAIRKEAADAAKVLNDQTAAAIAGIEEESTAAKVAAADIRHQVEKEVRESEPELQRLAADLATARTKAAESVRVQTTREMAEKHSREAQGFKAKSEELTAAIAVLDETKTALAKDLPIAGLEVDGKEIRVDGVPFDQLNTAKRIAIAVQIATLRAADQRLKVVFLDGLEALDTEGQRLLFEALEAADIQAFVAKVDDCPLTVVADGEAMEVATA